MIDQKHEAAFGGWEMKLIGPQTDTLRLILRSPDLGDGWRQVSATLWQHVQSWAPAELVEFDQDNKRIRLNGDGNVLARYI